MKKLFLDFDGVIVNTIEAIVSLYQDDFCMYENFKPVNWTDIKTWDFHELESATPEYIDTYFNQPRFFERVTYMDWAKETIEELQQYFKEIIIVSTGYIPNLRLKEKWIKENIHNVKFIGVNLEKYKDKSHVDMSNGIFIDDSSQNLITSNADIKICFGDVYEWNEDWEMTRCFNWTDVKRMLIS